MDEKYIFEKHFNSENYPENERNNIRKYLSNSLFSVHWELKIILYLGVLLLSSGIGILIYKNIDTIGHITIISLIALATFGCFVYAFREKLPYSNTEVKHSNPFYDYIILLGSLLFVTFLGYLQFQYEIFSEHIQYISLLIAIVYFSIAYLFDHRGVLSMAITSLSAFVGITVKPLDFFGSNFASQEMVISGLFLGLSFCLLSYISIKYNIKNHFYFTYLNFGAQLVFISLLTGLFTFDTKFVLFILLLIASVGAYKYAVTQKSYYFLLMGVVYAYVGLTYYIFYTLDSINSLDSFEYDVGVLYFIFSSISIVAFFLNFKKILHG